MYVDKVLHRPQRRPDAVTAQRIHTEKDSTFVLDFRNDTDTITKAFEPYYGRTVAPPTDPNLLWDTRSQLDQYDVLRIDEVEDTVTVLITMSESKDHGQLYALLDPAVDRFKAPRRG